MILIQPEIQLTVNPNGNISPHCGLKSNPSLSPPTGGFIAINNTFLLRFIPLTYRPLL